MIRHDFRVEGETVVVEFTVIETGDQFTLHYTVDEAKATAAWLGEAVDQITRNRNAQTSR